MNNYSDPMVTYDEIVEALRAIIDCSKANGYLEEYGFLNVKYDSLNQNPIQKEQEQALLNALQSLEKTINAANKVIRENLEKELAEISATNIFRISSTYEHSREKRKLASQSELVMRLKEMSLPLEVLNKIEQPVIEEIEIINELPSGFEEITEDEEEPLQEEVVIDIVEETPEVSVENDSLVEEDYSVEDSLIGENILTEEPTVELEPAVELDFSEEEETPVEENASTEVTVNSEEKKNVEPEQEVEEAIEYEPLSLEGEFEIEKPIDRTKKEEPEKIQLIRKALEKARDKGNDQLVKVLEFQLNRELKNLN